MSTKIIVKLFISNIIQTVLCFNYMAILGEVADPIPYPAYQPSYINFYSGMIKTPFIGTKYNYIMAFCICVVGLIFALMSLLNCQNKALNTLKKVNKRFDETEK